ncbi:MAG: YraN family protein [Rhizonema sp. PD37]|nr:YraN family protein [Rhizonema sp. PD37]
MAHPPYNYHDIGTAGENLVAQWLESQGWRILHRRWRYRQGEIDIIAQKDELGTNNFSECSSPSPILIFVEVKTRSPGNWDAGGRSAIALKKQTTICRTAQMFLAHYPDKADYSCRFDVAIICCQQKSKELAAVTFTQQAIASSSVAGHLLILQEYIPAAFDAV